MQSNFNNVPVTKLGT